MFFCCISLPHFKWQFLKLLAAIEWVHGAKKRVTGWKQFTSHLTATFLERRLLVSLATTPVDSCGCNCSPNFPTSRFLIFTSCFQAQVEQKPSISYPGSCAAMAWTDAFNISLQESKQLSFWVFVQLPDGWQLYPSGRESLTMHGPFLDFWFLSHLCCAILCVSANV